MRSSFMVRFVIMFFVIIFCLSSASSTSGVEALTENGLIYHTFDGLTPDRFIPINNIAKSSPLVADGWMPAEGNTTLLSSTPPANTSVHINTSPNIIIGPDDRTRVILTTSYPWSAVPQIEFYRSDGTLEACTGWFIGASTIMTAAHCIWLVDDNTGQVFGFGQNYRIYPGRDGNTFPLQICKGVAASVPTQWVNNVDLNYDWGKIDLDCHVGFTTGVLGFRSTAGDIGDPNVTAVGYPGINPSGIDNYASMWKGNGTMLGTTTYELYFNNDMTGGQSGGPLWQQSFNGCSTPCPVGILATEYPNAAKNAASRITPELFSLMVQWRKWVYGRLYMPLLVR